jgi:hypothetical protein
MDMNDIITNLFQDMKMQLIKGKKSDVACIVDENMNKLMGHMACKNASFYDDLLKQMEIISMPDK